MSETQIARPSLRQIKDAVCEEFGVTLLDLESSRRTRAIARPRQVTMWLGRHLTPLSLPQIGKGLGYRDHTTIMHGIASIDRVMSADEDFAVRVRRLRKSVEDAQVVWWVVWTNEDGDPGRFPYALARNAAETVVRQLTREKPSVAYHMISNDRIGEWITGTATRFFLGWITPDGIRDASPSTLPAEHIDRLVTKINSYTDDLGTYVAIPSGRLNGWKDGTWTP